MIQETQQLSVSNLSYQTSTGETLLRDVSLGLEKGSILAIAGPNGAGKSTLLDLLAGMKKFHEGDVRIDGQSIATTTDRDRARKFAVVSQQSNADPRLSVADYVALGQMPIWAAYSTAEHSVSLSQALELTDLTRHAGKTMGQLSGGERQRAHIARALAQRPKLLFLDEPTNHLDPDAKGRMLSLVAGLGITVIMVVHDIVMIPEFATHLALMKDTELAAFGPVADVLTPETVRKTFGVEYLLLPHDGREIPALDIRNSNHLL